MIDYKKKLNQKQFEAATHIDGPMLILAGAGSGKTRTLIYRVSFLIDIGINPESILLLTFTNKAADEMKSRAAALGDPRCNRIKAGTFHSFCADQLRRYSFLCGRSSNFSILASSDVADAVGFVKSNAGKKYTKLRGFPNNKTLASIFSVAINKNMTIEDVLNSPEFGYNRYSSFIDEIEEINVLYEEYKEEKNMMDFDDLLVNFNWLLMNQRDIRNFISDQYEYIMVDEYQDTNRLQESIIRQLRVRNKNIVVVGDDYQSIYAFRGAELDNILTFPSKFKDTKVVTLDTNYRSSEGIVDFSNSLMNNNVTIGFNKYMTATFDNNKKPDVTRVYDKDEQAEYVLKDILLAKANDIPNKEICVMARAANSFNMLEAKLTSLDINYVKYGGPKFFEYEAILDVIAFLKVLSNSKDQLAWYRILKLYPGIGDAYAGRISQTCTDMKNFLLNPDWSGRVYSKYLVELDSKFKYFRNRDFDGLIDELVDYYKVIKRRSIEEARVRDEANRTENLLRFDTETIELLNNFVDIFYGYKSIQSFLDDIVLDRSKNAIDPEDSIVLTTIHSAKGLEFDTVILIDCTDGEFPRTDAVARGSKEDNEELRCFYVAVTRAKNTLKIYSPKFVGYGRNKRLGYLSHYLDGLNSVYNYKETMNSGSFNFGKYKKK